MKLTDDYAAGNTDAHKSPVDQRYRLITNIQAAFQASLDVLHSTGFGVYSGRTAMTEENTDDLCKDCDPTFKAFLQRVADHNEEQVRNGKFTCPTCGKVHEYTLPNPPVSTKGQ